MELPKCTTLNEYLELWSKTCPDRNLYTFFDRNGRHSVCKASELYTLAGRFASQLRRQGFQAGDIICNAIPNSKERLITQFGIILAGCVEINCQVMEKDGADFWHMAQLCGCVAIIVPIRDDNSSYRLLKQHLPEVIPDSGYVPVSIQNSPKLKTILLVDRYSSLDASGRNTPSLISHLTESEIETFTHKPNSSDLAYIFQTSGSTGYCKLIPRTHDEIFLAANAYPAPLDPSAAIYFNDRPFGWTGGFPYRLFQNGSLVVAQDCFDGKQTHNLRELWREIAREKCSSAFILPRHVLQLVAEYRTDPPEFKMDVLITGGQPMTKVITEALGVLTKALVTTYASTEAFVVTNYFVNDKSQFHDYMCGPPFGDARIKVVDEDMHDVTPGTAGQILVKTNRLLRHYYNQVPATPIFTPDGWFITGDKGWLDEKGYLYVGGRNDNVINHGAILVYPSWPESVLSRHPDVREVVVIGVPDGTGAGKLCACVVLKEESSLTNADLRKFYEDSFLNCDRNEYIPTLSYIEFLDKIPKTFNTKINGRLLRQLIFQRLGVAQ